MSDVNGELMDIIAGFHDDPVGYINYVFPWGEEGTPLEQYDGLRDWQLEFFTDLGEQIKERGFDGINPAEPIQFSTSSGHGIGKSACTAMLIKFIHDTRPFSKGVVTANTSDQLKTKTWAELGKWHNMSITKDWSAYNSGKGNMNLRNIENPETWRVDAQTSKDENSESFAGLHAANSTPFYIFDEASAVAESIYEVANGGLTDGEPMWFLFGNPTRNSGYFHSTHNKFKHRWTTRTIDSRDVEGTNNGLFAKWIEDFGEDSDFVRVRVRGLFPRSGSTQFISTDFIEGAINRDGYPDKTDPLIIGVDVARQGDDQSVIYFRRGRDARTTEPLKLRLSDTMDLVGVVSQVLSGAHPVTNRAVPQACFIDGCGVGGGVVDRLRQLGFDVIDVNAATKADNNQIFRLSELFNLQASQSLQLHC